MPSMCFHGAGTKYLSKVLVVPEDEVSRRIRPKSIEFFFIVDALLQIIGIKDIEIHLTAKCTKNAQSAQRITSITLRPFLHNL